MNGKIFKALYVFVFLLASVFAVQAQHVEELYSPYFLGLGPQTTSLEAPLATELNPAAAALEQRIRLELNYTTLIGSALNPGWGNALNAGLSLPTNAGVFSFAGYYMGSPLVRPNLGSLGGLTISFSKDLLPNFLVGLGVTGIVGGQAGVSDWGLGANLGVTHVIGKLLFLEDFTWAAAFRNIGKGFSPTADNNNFPGAFTPAASVSAKLIKTDPFTLGLYSDISFPSFQNILYFGALDMDIFHFLIARASYRLDLRELIEPAADRFPFTFGISVNFRIDLEKKVDFLSERGWSKNDIRFDVAVAPLADGAFAAGVGLNAALGMRDTKPPQVSLKPALPDTQPRDDATVYVSPNLDGTQDTLDLPLSITDERYVKGYRLIIKDEKGNVVRTIENKETRAENLDLDNVIKRMLYVKSGVQIPASIAWDGKNDTGTVVPDGTYTYSVEAWDDNDNKAATEPQKVVIDTTEPKAEIKAPYTIFSPNGDGSKDALPLQISGSAEDAWKGEVFNEKGAVVATFQWQGQPKDLTWDGKSSSGAPLPDGVYSIALSSKDRAGNATVKKFDNIIINTQATPVFMTVDSEIFSPNGDKIADTANFDVVLGIPEGIKSWTLEMVHEKNGTERTFSGAQAPAAKFSWDGRKDDGSRADEGLFTAKLTVEYDKGDKPVAQTRAFRLDVSPPATEITLSPSPFSPDNDGVEDELVISTKVTDPSDVAEWNMEILDPMGKHFTSFKGEGTPSAAFVWDGISDKGELVQAASDYKLKLTITDTVGNKTTVEKTIMVDVLVMRDGDKLYIRVPSITFKPDTADYKSVAKDALEKNLWTIQRLSVIFKKYRTYKIQIEGHAVSVYWRDQARSEKEQIEELIPLSTKRAEAIKQALGGLGIDASRISTVGVGASRPIVPFSDEENLWKDRRVEFILLKQ
jgi:outer membrane protein OmpA-like peptidoglycan-associated protein/flagellar hook assembly protein FlgD